jgi:hypothetical protein
VKSLRATRPLRLRPCCSDASAVGMQADMANAAGIAIQADKLAGVAALFFTGASITRSTRSLVAGTPPEHRQGQWTGKPRGGEGEVSPSAPSMPSRSFSSDFSRSGPPHGHAPARRTALTERDEGKPNGRLPASMLF